MKTTILLSILIIPFYFNPLMQSSFTEAKLTALKLLVVLALGLFLLSFNNIQKRPLNGRLMGLLVLNCVPLIISFLVSINQYQSFFGSYTRGMGIFTYLCIFILAWLSSYIDKESLINYMIVAGTIVAFYALIQYAGLDFSDATKIFGRPTSTIGNAIPLGAFLILVIPLTYYKKHWIPLITQVMALFTTSSRGPILGLAAALILYFLITDLNWRKVFIGAIFVVGGLVILFFGRGVDSTALKVRFGIWNHATGVMHSSTTARQLLGYGLDNVQPALNIVVRNEGYVDKAHNQILETTLGTGVLGLIVYLLTYIVLVFCLKKRKDELGIIVLCTMTGYFVQSQFGIETISLLLYFWILVRIACENGSDNNNIPCEHK